MRNKFFFGVVGFFLFVLFVLFAMHVARAATMRKIPQGTAMKQMKAMDDAMENMDMTAMAATVTHMDGRMIAMSGMKMTGDMTV